MTPGPQQHHGHQDGGEAVQHYHSLLGLEVEQHHRGGDQHDAKAYCAHDGGAGGYDEDADEKFEPGYQSWA